MTIMKSKRTKTLKEIFILSVTLLICISTTAIAHIHNTASDLSTSAYSEEEAEFAFIEALPIEVAVQISSIEDQRPLVDRITMEMLGEIAVYDPYNCDLPETAGKE